MPDSLRLLGEELVAARRRSRMLAAALGEEGLRPEHWEVLRVLVAEDECTMSLLAETLAIPPPSAKRLVDELVDRAAVYRVESPTDGRRVVVRVSVLGQARLERADALVSARLRAAVSAG